MGLLTANQTAENLIMGWVGAGGKKEDCAGVDRPVWL